MLPLSLHATAEDPHATMKDQKTACCKDSVQPNKQINIFLKNRESKSVNPGLGEDVKQQEVLLVVT